MKPDTYKKNQIIFGSGGGFAHIVREFRLLENGKAYFKKSTDSAFTELGKKNIDSVKVLFAKTKVLFEEVKDFHEPGNMYYFIKFKQDSTTKELVWGDSKENTPQKAKELYKELMNLVNLK